MNAQRIGRWLGSTVLAGLLCSSLSAVPARAQTADLATQVQRLQRDLRDLQAEVFRGRPIPPGQTLAPEVLEPEGNTFRERVGEIEEGLRRLTGEMEELGHRVDLLTQQNERLQKQLDFMANQAAQAQAEPSASSSAPDTLASAEQTRPPALAPATGSLGTLPRGTPMPEARAADNDPKAEFDAAMGLLTRAQYDRAREGFRTFADAHPDTELAAQALYWTGDIAYSTKKDYANAARDFAELLKKYPKAPRAPEGMLKLGLSLVALGQKKEGCVALAALPKNYPNAAPALINRAKAESKNACA